MDHTPPLWFHLPPGYQPFDPVDLEPIRERAPRWARPMDEIFQHGTFYAALGLHRTDAYEVVTTSLFTLSAMRTLAGDAQFAAGRALISRAGWPHWSVDASELRTVGRDTPAAFTAGVLRCGGDDESTVYQAAYTFLVPGTPSLTTATLTSADLSQSAALAEVLHAVAATISFEAPSPAPAPLRFTSRIAELLT